MGTRVRMNSHAFVLIPVHNRKHTTLRCLEHLRATGDLADCRVVVINDGSTDGTAQMLAERFADEVEVLSGDGDLWWTGAMVLGMRHALAQDARFIFWLNDDCLPDAGTLPAMIAFMSEQPDTLVAPVCYPLGRPEEWLETGFIGRRTFAPKRGETVAVEGFSGFCVGMPVQVCRRIGLPDAQAFPHYAGDGMYTLTAVRAGFRALVIGTCAAALAEHDPGVLNLENFVDRRLGFRGAFAAIFLRKKSRFFLRTRFFYSRTKYGPWLGSVVFGVRAVRWITKFCALWTFPPGGRRAPLPSADTAASRKTPET